MPTLSDVNFDALYCMFKGEPGTRKSTQALSFPLPQYWFSWDRKMAALKIPMRNWGIDPKQVSYDDYEDWDKGRIKLEQFQLNCPFKTLIIDTVTSCADASLRQTRAKKYGTVRASSGKEAGIRIGGISINELEDYNAEAAALSEMVALTKDIYKFHKVNIILIAHVIQVDYAKPDRTTVVSRSIVTAAKKIAAKIPAYCDEVYHFDIEKGFVEGGGGEYRILTTHTGDDFARTTLPLPAVIKYGNKALYDSYLKPAITNMTQSPDNKPQQTTNFTV